MTFGTEIFEHDIKEFTFPDQVRQLFLVDAQGRIEENSNSADRLEPLQSDRL
jgi:hypothetical protein